MKKPFRLVLAAALVVPVLSAQSGTLSDTKIQLSVQKALKSRRFMSLQSSVQDGVVTLRGSVALYSVKLDAERRVSRVRGIQAIREEVHIAGPEIPDRQLQAELEKNLGLDKDPRTAYRRVYVEVKNGVVTLGGYADRRFRIFAIATVAQTRGVKGLHDVLEPGRSSPLDSMWPSGAPDVGGVSGP